MASNPLATAATNTDMKWAFPELVNPTVIDLSKTGGQDWWQFRPDEDVIFIGADTVRTANKLQTDGGRNIVVLGGEYQPQYDSKGATLHFLNLHGSVHVEGVKIDSSKASQDGIAVGGAPGKQPTVTVQNTQITKIHGTEGGVHGDVFQTHGSVGDMRFYNVTGDTSYQGFFISPQYSPGHKSADFENVNISYNGGSGYTYQYWFLDGDNQTPYPVTLKNVYATERSGQRAEDGSVWPKASMGAVRVGDQITWPNYPYKGAITVGEPAKAFAGNANTGLNFSVDGLKVPTGTTTPPTDGTDPTPAPTPEPTPDTTSADHPESQAPTNWIDATDPAAEVKGTAGNDQLAGVAGQADAHLEGGTGDDTYIVDQAGDTVIEAADGGVDTVLSYADDHTLAANVENLVLGGSNDANGTGNDLANRMVGNEGANVLNGAAGDDLLVGGAGNDTFVVAKGEGNDVIADFATGDKVDLQGFGLTEFGQLKLAEKDGSVILTLDGEQTLTFRGITSADLTAESFGFKPGTEPTTPTDPADPTDMAPASLPVSNAPTNTITGTAKSETLKGTAANDKIVGNGGIDKMIGGKGSDTYVVDSSGDRIVEGSGHGLDTVESSAFSYALPKFVENLTLTGKAVMGTGTNYHNLMVGNDKANVLLGAGGNDVLVGGKGADILAGGSGDDTFAYGSVEDAGDVIVDFVIGKDNIDIRGLLSELGSDSTKPGTDGLVEVVQSGADAAVMVNLPEADPVKLVTVENVDALALHATADHWA